MVCSFSQVAHSDSKTALEERQAASEQEAALLRSQLQGAELGREAEQKAHVELQVWPGLFRCPLKARFSPACQPCTL